MTPLRDCPYFRAWVANTVAELSDMAEHSCGPASERALTSVQTRMECLSSGPGKFADQASERAARLALADLLADFRNLH